MILFSHHQPFSQLDKQGPKIIAAMGDALLQRVHAWFFGHEHRCVIKRLVSIACRDDFHEPALLTPSARKRRESTLWQRRFWEHQIRDENDFERHVDYIHFNPVKHRYVQRACDWPHSTFHRYVREKIYPQDWGASQHIADSYWE